MALITTISIPVNWLRLSIRDFDVKQNDATWVKSTLRQFLQEKILEGANLNDFAPNEIPPKLTINLSIPEPAGSIAINRAKQAGLSPGQYIKKLIGHAAFCKTSEDKLTMPAEASPLLNLIAKMKQAGLDTSERYEQAVHFTHLLDSLENGRIGMCEAGTGTGKTMAMVYAALLMAKEKNSRVTLTFPTIALMYQAAKTYQSIAPYLEDSPALRIILGRNEFVSKDALIAFLDGYDGPEKNKILTWIKNDAPAPEGFGFEDTRWLAASLYLLEPKIPLSEVTLPEFVKETDPGYIAYKNAFSVGRENGAELQICSHSMLAQDLRRKMNVANRDETGKEFNEQYFELLGKIKDSDDITTKSILRSVANKIDEQRRENFINLTEDRGLLPSSRYLLIDEAHQFETNLSLALSDYVSMKGMLRSLSEFKKLGGKIANSTISNVAELVSSICKAGSYEKDIVQLGKESGKEIYAICRQISDVIGDIKIPKNAPVELSACYFKLKKMLSTLRVACSDRKSNAFMQYSPVLQFPQLYVGKLTVANVLARLWDTQVAVAIVSATLYLRRGDGYSSGYQQMILNVPKTRVKEYQPISPAWLIKTVKEVVLPGKTREGTPRLRPPTLSDRLNPQERERRETEFLNQVATELQSIYEESVGGVLVLMSSFESVKYLSEKLPNLKHCLVLALDNGPNLNSQSEQFLHLSQSEKKPIWLAVGGAWTGLDIGGHQLTPPLDAAVDNVLTTLVIPRLPFGNNRSITHAHRILKNPEIPWEMLEMAIRFRQGLGRLVRREGLPNNRKIFVLDGRLEDTNFDGLLTNVKLHIESYLHVTRLTSSQG